MVVYIMLTMIELMGKLGHTSAGGKEGCTGVGNS